MPNPGSLPMGVVLPGPRSLLGLSLVPGPLPGLGIPGTRSLLGRWVYQGYTRVGGYTREVY